MEQLLDFLIKNWEWALLVFYVAEKIVKATPTKKDDILFDMIIKPIMQKGKKE